MAATSEPRIIRCRSMRALVMLLASLAALWFMSGHTDRMLVGDPAEYRDRVAAIVGGGLPYLDVPFEHLPVMLVPMLGAWFMGGALSQASYVLVFALLMGVVMTATTWIVDSLGVRLGVPSAGGQWLLITVPMLPLVLFRNDPFAVLLGVAALGLVAADAREWTVAAVAGALAKVWPAVLGLLAWPRRRIGSISVLLGGFLGFGITLFPGFADRRNAAGIHTETVMGGVVGLARTLTGEGVGVVITTAAYLEVRPWVLVANATFGLVLLAYATWAVLAVEQLQSKAVRLGAVVIGVILVSPLFSLQYLLWVIPFLVLSHRRLGVLAGIALAVMTMWLGWTWDPPVLETPAFYIAVCVRNALLVSTAVWLSREPTTEH